MALIVNATNPEALLTAIKKAIDNKQIDNWTYDHTGDFTKTVTPWTEQAWLRPSANQNVLMLGLVGRTGVEMSKETYSRYHSRFIELLLSMFDSSFTVVTATAYADSTVDMFRSPAIR